MSFSKLTKKELVRTAVDDFGIDVDKTRDKSGIVEQLVENGVTWEMYLEENPDKREEFGKVPDNVIRRSEATVDESFDVAYPERSKPTPEETENLILVRMVRPNPYYEVRGYAFSQANPFVLVKEDDVDHILLQEDGFRQATPREVKEYYS